MLFTKLSRKAAKIMKPHFARTLTVACFVLKFHLLCESCQNSFVTFEQILQTRQQYGRSLPNASVKLLKKRVLSKMECLDICLRNPTCHGFQMRHKTSNNTAKHWICQINWRINSTEVKQAKRRGSNHWIHFNVSSRELQQVSSSVSRANGQETR